MIGKRKSSSHVMRAGRPEADLGQKEAELEKTQAEPAGATAPISVSGIVSM